MRSAVVIGASIGGLVAAAQLRAAGWAVTLLERGRSVGGLFSRVETPFGTCELGMHVLYVSAEQQALLTGLFGPETFIEKQGVDIDLGAAFNHGVLNTDSIYPDVRGLPEQALMLQQLQQRGAGEASDGGANARAALHQRFGAAAADAIVAPILQKLWGCPAEQLAPGALHCFFDLRRIIVADKLQTDLLKQDARLDAVVGNPQQRSPAGAVFGGRRALFFRDGAHDLSARVIDNLGAQGIVTEFGCDVQMVDDRLCLRGNALSERFDACIVASPIAALDPGLSGQLDQLELSIHYFKIRPFPLPAYYVLCHGAGLAASRIVNYAAYNFDRVPHLDQMLAVETLHPLGQPPGIERIRAEVSKVLTGLEVVDEHALPQRLKIAGPTLTNAARLDARLARLQAQSGFKALHFVGMRTDQGVFFSHQTIGAAHAAALDCSRQLP